MSSFWSIWITVLTLATLVGCYLILRWCLKNFTDVKEGESMGHAFDGIEELNNPLPKWWSNFFLITIIWGFGYLLLYPGLGNFAGLLGWKSSNQQVRSIEESKAAAQQALEQGLLVQYDREVAAADAKFGPLFAKFAEQDITVLASNKEALDIGQRLFLQNCAQCHGSDAKGSTGFPNLADKDWLYGGDAAAIKQSIMQGRNATGMMAWGAVLGGEQGVSEVAEYVLSLSGRENLDPSLVSAGQAKFAMCMGCHGPQGKGNTMLGAPNLSDNIWLYGGSRKAVQESIRNGRAGVMPAWKDILGEDKVHLISSYVYSLSN
jgi:cytochrome c oxidase cbb3-type subunit 3